jgi:hypothetical protein
MWRPEGRYPVLIAATAADERVTTAHRAKLAYVYVRQSSLNQVKLHQESTALQYRLVDRAVALGWPHGRVQVIDEDLGKSGAGSVKRRGFQKLIAEIGLGNAGLVVSLDASRLARNNRDWHARSPWNLDPNILTHKSPCEPNPGPRPHPTRSAHEDRPGWHNDP